MSDTPTRGSGDRDDPGRGDRDDPGRFDRDRGSRGRRGRWLDVALRLALVLVLLGLAAHALSGRRELDWERISEPPDSPWVPLVLVGLATFLLVVVARTLIRFLRPPPPTDEDGPDLEGRELSFLAYVVAALLCAGALVAIYLLLRSGFFAPDQLADQGQQSGVPVDLRPQGDRPVVDSRALLLTVAIAVALGLAVSTIVRRNRAADEDEPEDELADEGGDRTALAEAVAAAEEELDAHGDDTRAAIIAAYLAMERQLAFSGTTRRRSDTPTDFLVRAVAGSRVSRGAATRLTELFREARFSTHPMAPRAREDAARALARVAKDLTDAGR